MADAASRPLRADAARNRVRILDAARVAFAEGGLDIGVEEIARRAGVGKGTLYRRFPTKESLVLAIMQDRVAELEQLAEDVAYEPDAGEAFARFLGEAARMQATNQGFYDVVAARRDGTRLDADAIARFLDALERPLRRAQEAGSVRDDLVAEDVPMLLRMVGATTRPTPDGQSMDERWPRYLELILDGLRPDAATPLAAPPWRSRTRARSSDHQ